MQVNKKFGFNLSIVGLFVVVVLLLELRNGKRLREDYPLLDSQIELKNVVTEVKKSHGTCFIEVDKKKYRIPSSVNNAYKDEYLSHNLFTGDSIIKYEGSNTLFVIRDSVRLKFVLGKNINEE